MRKNEFYIPEEDVFMVVCALPQKTHVVFTTENDPIYNKLFFNESETVANIYERWIQTIGEWLVSKVVLLNYISECRNASIDVTININNIQAALELACHECGVSFSTITYSDVKSIVSTSLSSNKSMSDNGHAVAKLASYYQNLQEIRKYKNVIEYNKTNIDVLKNIDILTNGTYMGVVYALEYGDFVKIGSTVHPYRRFVTLKNQAEKYGNVKIGKLAISGLHTNFRENERNAHREFEIRRQDGTELFNIGFDTARNYLNNLELLDESEKIRERVEKITNGIKELVGGIIPCKNIRL